jgi:hypothetical protein
MLSRCKYSQIIASISAPTMRRGPSPSAPGLHGAVQDLAKSACAGTREQARAGLSSGHARRHWPHPIDVLAYSHRPCHFQQQVPDCWFHASLLPFFRLWASRRHTSLISRTGDSLAHPCPTKGYQANTMIGSIAPPLRDLTAFANISMLWVCF